MLKLIVSLSLIITLSACTFFKVIIRADEPNGKKYYELYENGDIRVTKVRKNRPSQSTRYLTDSRESLKHKKRLLELLKARKIQQELDEKELAILKKEAEEANRQKAIQDKEDEEEEKALEEFYEREKQD